MAFQKLDDIPGVGLWNITQKPCADTTCQATASDSRQFSWACECSIDPGGDCAVAINRFNPI